MGRGSRHSKNAGTMGTEALTYNERRALGHGTLEERLGKDSIGNYYDCALTLQPAVDPVCTPAGHIFSKEAILEYLAQQKKMKKRALAAFEAQEKGEAQQELEKDMLREQAKLLAFDRQNHIGGSETMTAAISDAIHQEADAMHGERHAKGTVNIGDYKNTMKEMKAFWLPMNTPGSKASMERPSMEVLCPVSGKKLRMKDLIALKFKEVPRAVTESVKDAGLYMDPVSDDIFTNASKLVCLKPTGTVMLESTYKRLVKPDGAYDGKRIKEKDVIRLQKGGTGFAAHEGERAKAGTFFALGAGSGRQDLRGQAAAGPSRGGLTIMN